MATPKATDGDTYSGINIAPQRIGGINTDEINHSFTDSGTESGNSSTEDLDTLLRVFGPLGLQSHVVGTDAWSREINFTATNEGIPLAVILAHGAGTPTTPYQGTVENPNLPTDIKDKVKKLYPHPANPALFDLGANGEPTPGKALKRGMYYLQYLQESWNAHKQGLLSDAALKNAITKAYSVPEIYDAYAWQNNLLHINAVPPETAAALKQNINAAKSIPEIYDAYALQNSFLTSKETPLQAVPRSEKKYPANLDGDAVTFLKMLTHQNQDEYVRYQTPWEVAADTGITTSLIQEAKLKQAENIQESLEHAKKFEELKGIVPKDIWEWANKSDKPSAWKYNYAILATEERDQSQRLSNYTGVDFWKSLGGGFVGDGIIFAPVGAVSGKLMGLGSDTITAFNARFGATEVNLLKGGAPTIQKELIRHPLQSIKNDWVRNGLEGAGAMYGFSAAGQVLKHNVTPTELPEMDFVPHPETLLLGVGLGIFGTALGRLGEWAKTPTKIKELTDTLVSEHTSHVENLKKQKEGDIASNEQQNTVYSTLMDNLVKATKEKRTYTEEEQTYRTENEAYFNRAKAASINPAATKLVIKAAIGDLEKELNLGVEPSLVNSLTERINKTNIADRENIDRALLNSRSFDNEARGDINKIHNALDIIQTATLKERAGADLRHSDVIQKTLSKILEDVQHPNKFSQQRAKTEIEAALTQVKKENPELGDIFEKAVRHHELLKGELRTSKDRVQFEDRLIQAIGSLETSIKHDTVDLSVLKAEDLAKGEEINRLVAGLNEKFPIAHNGLRFKDASEILNKPDTLEKINADPSLGEVFKNEIVRDWHKEKLGNSFNPGDIKFNELTGKFEKVDRVKPEPPDESHPKVDEDGCE